MEGGRVSAGKAQRERDREIEDSRHDLGIDVQIVGCSLKAADIWISSPRETETETERAAEREKGRGRTQTDLSFLLPSS